MRKLIRVIVCFIFGALLIIIGAGAGFGFAALIAFGGKVVVLMALAAACLVAMLFLKVINDKRD